MRFITEFELRKEECNNSEWVEYAIQRHMIMRQIEMGDMLSSSFGWQNPINGNNLHHRLEIEAFPMDKWVEFKNRLFSHIDFCNGEDRPVDEIRVLSLIKELESFGKEQSK